MVAGVAGVLAYWRGGLAAENEEGLHSTGTPKHQYDSASLLHATYDFTGGSRGKGTTARF